MKAKFYFALAAVLVLLGNFVFAADFIVPQQKIVGAETRGINGPAGCGAVTADTGGSGFPGPKPPEG